jgi:hypothetical protein
MREEARLQSREADTKECTGVVRYTTGTELAAKPFQVASTIRSSGSSNVVLRLFLR